MSKLAVASTAPGVTTGPHSVPDERVRREVSERSQDDLQGFDLLRDVLEVDVAPQFLRSALNAIVDSADLLKAWQAARVDTYGLCGLALLLKGQSDLLSMAGPSRPTEVAVKSDFRKALPLARLYGLMVARYPYHSDEELKERLRAVRTWLLLQAVCADSNLTHPAD